MSKKSMSEQKTQMNEKKRMNFKKLPKKLQIWRINFIELVIEKCNNIESCQELNDCRKAVVMDSHKLSNTTIYISYSVEMYNKLMILVQYKNKHIICVDASNSLLVRKIVMNASEPQTISTSENIFRQIDQVSTSVFDPQFTLYSGNIGYIYILQCRFCTTELTINCQNGDPLITVDASNTSKIVFSDGSVVEGWQKINFSQTLHKKTYTNCSLVFTTNTTNDFPITHFWIIDRCVVDITKPAENENPAVVFINQIVYKTLNLVNCLKEEKRGKLWCAGNVLTPV
ncbi:hypothetical protein MTP99_012079 [Tenebrio molitor]|nr:hypothetical protein MTP99_012079 [Tenebrio molitor]